MRVSNSKQSLFWLVGVWMCCSCSVPVVSGQRAVASLGKRLQQRFGGSAAKQRGSTGDETYTLEGETHLFRYYYQRLLSSSSSSSPSSSPYLAALMASAEASPVLASAVGTTILAILVGLLLYLLHTIDKRITEDDEIVAPGESLEKVDLAFEDLMLTLDLGKKKNGKHSGTNGDNQRLLLDGSIRGRAQPGRMMAIMGPSGAGKSTLLHALAGRVKDSPKLKLAGQRYMNGVPVDGASMIPSAFIMQEVSFFPHMTVRETLDFRVELKLGAKLSKRARDTMVVDLIRQLGLTAAADTIVGNQKVRGISGGERKRLSIAVEMISAPSVIFLDEPTSGLDSTAAFTLIQTLRELADAGKTIVAVIHQPSQHVFAKFDDLLLLSEGKQMYSGELNSARSYMEEHGFPAPFEMGTAEHILDCVSRAPFENETQEEADERVEQLAAVARAHPVDLGAQTEEKNHNQAKMAKHYGLMNRGGPKSSLLTQFRLLLTRSFREITRGKTTLAVKAAQQVTLGLIYGGIYSLGTNQSSIQDRFGLLSLIAIGLANSAIASTSRAFLREKGVVQEELTAKMYRTFPYFVGKALSEFPITGLFSSLFGGLVYKLTGMSSAPGKFRNFMMLLFTHCATCEAAGLVIGAISPNTDVSLAIFPAVIVLNIIFDGKNISEENTPVLLRWIPKLGLIRWGFEGLCLNEFKDLKFDVTGPQRGPVAKTGTDALARFGLGSNTLPDVFKAQAMITLSCWALSFLGLSLNRQKFLEMKSPVETNGKKE